ncbi:MAG: FAD/NAD(P)-binding oxidoreductase [Acidovorax sp.]|uniref:FAD-dependent oxidoreductase n=1 Tax=Acidovorax sp. TaxID=1872122 RepID=UPI0039E6DC04
MNGTAQHCDLLIVGAGPAGMAAALAAAPRGLAITLVDDNIHPGGQIWRDGPGVALPPLARQHRDALARHPNIRLLCGTRVVGLGGPAAPGDAPALLLEDAERGWTQHSRRLILCNGARELLLPFPGWTLPGVTGAGGLQALVKGGVPVRGQRIVVAGTGPLLLAAVDTARKAGAQVLRIAEQAAWQALAAFALQLPRWPAKALQAATLFNPRWRASSHVLRAEGAGALERVTLQRGPRPENQETLACDRLACGFGLVPNTQLGQLLGCGLNARQGLQVDALMATTVHGVHAAGECTGFGGSERALLQGAIAGHAATGDTARAQALWPALARWEGFADLLHRQFQLRDAVRHLAAPDTLVCRCEDVPHQALAGRTGWIDAKLHTRCGMGACQGRVCGAAAQVLYGWTPAPPRHLLAPVRIGTLARD